jgi:catechol 2,3-dioxygenase-like lactoylglutathione lyase family enzyme
MIEIEGLHHVSLPVTDLARARRFYEDVLGLKEMARPPFDFPGAWYALGNGQLHLIAHEHPTLRSGAVDSHDTHLALRVRSYGAALAALRRRGYSDNAADELKRVKEQPSGKAGFPQIFLLDPDRHVIELNAERVD